MQFLFFRKKCIFFFTKSFVNCAAYRENSLYGKYSKAYCRRQPCNKDNPAEFIQLLATAIQLVMHRCNLVISGSSEARNNNIDGFMSHGSPNDNHLPLKCIALQGQQLCEGSKFPKLLCNCMWNNAGKAINVKVSDCDLCFVMVRRLCKFLLEGEIFSQG